MQIKQLVVILCLSFTAFAQVQSVNNDNSANHTIRGTPPWSATTASGTTTIAGPPLGTLEPGAGILQQDASTPPHVKPIPATAVKCYVYQGTGGSGCDPAMGGGTPVAYTHVFANVNTLPGAGSLTALDCTAGNCTAATPAEDGTYSIEFTLIQTRAGVGCAATVQLQFLLTYMDGDGNNQVTGATIGMRPINSQTIVLTTAITANQANGAGNTFTNVPTYIRVKGGTPIIFNLNQLLTPNCTTTYPQMTFRLAVLGPLPYL